MHGGVPAVCLLMVFMVAGLDNHKSYKVRVSCPITIFMLHLQKFLTLQQN